MKVSNRPGIVRSAPTSRVRRSGASGSATASSGPRQIEDTVQVMGIPPEEMTDRVQRAILGLMEEVDSLRRELDHTNRRLRDMEDVADTDVLLPIANRRSFVRELNRMISFAERYGTPSTLMFLDLNDMKKINDTYGHEAGDKALLHVAKLLVEHVRGTDVVGRLGGDEFGVILAQADEVVGHQKAQELATMISNNPIEFEDKSVAMTLAFGIYTFRSGDQPDDALDKADKAMYENKKEIKGEDNVR